MQDSGDDNHDDIIDSDLDYDDWEDSGLSSEARCLEDDQLKLAPSASHKQRSRLVPFVLILIISGTAWYYYKKTTLEPEKPTPIVSLDSDTLTNSFEKKDAMFSKEAISTEMISNIESEETNKKNLTKSITTPVLTPFPSDIADRDITLPSLEQSKENSPDLLIGRSPAEKIDVTEEKPPLVAIEDKILSKTEEKLSIQPTKIEDEDTNQPKISAPKVNKQPPTRGIDANLSSDTLEKSEEKAVTPKIIIKETQKIKKENLQPKESTPQWVIRGAKPQVAVLYDKKTGDTQTVEVGNTIKGIGRVKSIHIENKKWVVKGTISTVTQ